MDKRVTESENDRKNDRKKEDEIIKMVSEVMMYENE